MTSKNRRAALIRQRQQKALTGVVEPYSRNKAKENKTEDKMEDKTQDETEENCTRWLPSRDQFKGKQSEIRDYKTRMVPGIWRGLLVFLRSRVF